MSEETMNDAPEQLNIVEEVELPAVVEKPISPIGITKKDRSPSTKSVKKSKDSRKKNRIKSRHKATKKEKRSRK